MALILNLYKNGICTESGLQCGLGVAGITGTLATKSNWYAMSQYGILFRPNVGTQYAGVVLSGATPIFNLASIPDLEKLSDPTKALISDKVSNSSSTYVYNAFFGGIESTSGNTLTSSVIEFYASNSGSYPSGGIRFRQYTQTPVDADKQSRQTWNYQSVSGYEFGAQMQGALERCINVYKINIWDTDYYLFAIGVSAGGDLNPNLKLVLIPVSHFKDREIKPYVGPVSKESAAAAYIGQREKQSVTGRDVSVSPNPYGFNSVSGFSLAKMTDSQYTQLIYQIFNGASGDLLNQAGQVVSDLIGGGGKRPAEEVKAIVDGVFCCHAVPVLGGYAPTGNVQLKTICGYSVMTGLTLPTVNPLQQDSIASGIIPRPSGCFLDFSPYTRVQLSIPYFGTLDIDPSAILGKSLSLDFTIDIFTGAAICAVSIIEPDGVQWIYATMQAKIATEMPIIGAGSNGAAIKSLSNGIMSIATQGAIGVAKAAYNTFDALQTAAQCEPVSRFSGSNSNAFISPYMAYITVTTPNNYNAGDFWELAGIPSHMSGVIGDFHGFTVFEHVDLSGVSGATETELQEIDAMLKGGVWL